MADEQEHTDDHEGHDHEGHEHEGHEHEGHDHEGHDHEGHDHGPGEESEETIAAMLEAIRQARVGQLVVSSISTFASMAYGKLEMQDLAEAKAAIDVIDALLPHLTGDEADIRREFEQALTGLKVAYANAIPSAQ
ncbi:MAG TPA: hypothetical protein VGM80_10870 [Gaiellaceae bacterium]